MADTPTLSNEKRLDEVEEALMLFMAILTGQPADATAEEREAAQVRMATIMERIRVRFVKRNEGKF